MFKSLSQREKIGLLVVACLIGGSVLMHNHPNMDVVQGQLKLKAPGMFRFFMTGEAVYFVGMLLMAMGLGGSLGPNPLKWGARLHELMNVASPGLVNARLFWLGFACNVYGSITFGGICLYVALEIIPGGARTLVPAALVDLAFSLFVRYAIYRRLSKTATSS